LVYHLELWIVLACVVPMYIVICTFHEMSHCLPLVQWGWRFKITPWPTIYEDRFYFGMYEWTEEGIEPPKWTWSLSQIAPRFPNWFLITVSCLWYHNIHMGYTYSTIIAMLGICSFIDCCVGLLPIWWYKERPYTDIWKFHKSTGIDLWILRLSSLAFVLFMAVMIFVPA